MKLIVLKNNVPINEVEVEIPDLEERYEIYVGRADDCHVLIDDPLISRHHFVLKNEKADWYCEKLTQLGVVLVNGSMGPKTKLTGGDEIKCGPYSIFVTDIPRMQVAQPEILQAAPVYQQPAAPVYQPTPAPEPLQDLEPLLDDSMETLGTLEEASPLDKEAPAEELNEHDGHGEENLDNNFGNDGESFDSDEAAPSTEEAGFADDASIALEAFPNEGEGGEVAERDEGTRFFRAFVNYQLVLFGENAPYDRFQIETDEIFIGRDTKKCQIILDDPEVSSVHAVVRKKGNDITLEDLNSSNGTILNGERINKAHVNTGDEFIVGSTTFTLEVKSDLLDAESDRLMPVEEGQYIETEEIQEEEVTMAGDGDINFDSDAPQEKSLLKRIWKDPVKRKKLIYGLVAVVIGYVILVPEQKEEIPQELKKATETKIDEKSKDGKPVKVISDADKERMEIAYELGASYFEQNRYSEAKDKFDTVVTIDPEYKKVQTYLEQTIVAMKRLEELEVQKRAEEERIVKKKKIEELLVKAREAVKDKKVQVAESIFSQIAEMDPENIEVSQLKLELESWQKDEERKALEEAAKIAARKKMVDQLAPGKTSYLKKEWYRSILKLEEFMRITGMDEDLVKEGSDMLSDSKNQLASELGPLLGKARSLKEGQDYKNAYESYLEILKLEPTNPEALNEVDEIKSQLETRSKRIYREAIISESLSLFADAKEKFQEVQQISPTDSEYYRKASDKLKNYME
ncbi:MAG TPA: FHA domain-containing protein [Bacteriovoracaceae bacterium]|nr:FHA domain-containing protein [Bacteriovoracaceae bacterium]